MYINVSEYGDLTFHLKEYIVSMINLYGWSTIEIVSGVLLFFLCLFERCYDPIYTSVSKSKFKFIGQLGLYIECILAVYMWIDGYYLMVYHNIPKIFTIFFIIAAVLTKFYLVTLYLERKKDAFSSN
jgi:hypothetical protein